MNKTILTRTHMWGRFAFVLPFILVLSACQGAQNNLSEIKEIPSPKDSFPIPSSNPDQKIRPFSSPGLSNDLMVLEDCQSSGLRINQWQESLVLAPFDPVLGKLKEVRFNLEGEIQGVLSGVDQLRSKTDLPLKLTGKLQLHFPDGQTITLNPEAILTDKNSPVNKAQPGWTSLEPGMDTRVLIYTKKLDEFQIKDVLMLQATGKVLTAEPNQDDQIKIVSRSRLKVCVEYVYTGVE